MLLHNLYTKYLQILQIFTNIDEYPCLNYRQLILDSLFLPSLTQLLLAAGLFSLDCEQLLIVYLDPHCTETIASVTDISFYANLF